MTKEGTRAERGAELVVQALQQKTVTGTAIPGLQVRLEFVI